MLLTIHLIIQLRHICLSYVTFVPRNTTIFLSMNTIFACDNTLSYYSSLYAFTSTRLKHFLNNITLLSSVKVLCRLFHSVTPQREILKDFSVVLSNCT